jgi:sigma-B regulation protein RsbU (phosphoserine phosphatase)
MEREFQIAKESQFALMPRTSPEIPGMDVKGFFIPSFDVGGDFYEHVYVKPESDRAGELVVSVVDVSGKAMKAALTAIYTSGLLMSRAMEKDEIPSFTLRDINTVLHARTDKLTFVTCALLRINVSTLEMKFSNAGHCHPVLVRNGKADFLKSEGPRLPLGIRESVAYEEMRIQLMPGDTLFVYSDGLPEARSKSGRIYGFDEVLTLFEETTRNHADSVTICENIKQEMLTFSDYELADDLTLVVVNV